ncbi:MAG: hypothetical protein H6755_00585 [Candidatus Omnitrophica bacterium]|nr:hypothetical protein [Candidatus Omnitrophota bacterium]MCB9746884.1 hypothetical protein [Candidatus Omnitrophota bacterium]
MNKELVKTKIEELSTSLLTELNAEIFELNIKQQGRTVVIELLVDKPEGGINIDECIYINKNLNEKLEQEQILEGDYVVEVSSPGIDRPLKVAKDFRRIKGKKIRVHLKDLVDGKLEYGGFLKDVRENEIIIESKNQDIKILLSNIQTGMQII